MKSALEFRIVVEHDVLPYLWTDHLGVEFWSVKLVVGGWLGDSTEDREAVIALADIWRVDNNVCVDQVFELDNISYDLGVIGSAVDSSERALSELSIHEGMNSSYLIANLVLVDRFWRGRRIGPAMVHFVSDLLVADAVFLKPVALVTHLDAKGRVDADYEVPRPGPAAQDKVRKAWRRAGFSKLVDGVVWSPNLESRRPATRQVLERIQDEANTARGRAWWRKRVTHAERHAQKPSV